MPARAVAWTFAVGIVFAASVARASGSGGDEADMVTWIERSCPTTANVETLVRLDQVAGKAVMDGLRQGRFRQAVRLVNAYLKCWSMQGALERSGMFETRLQALRQIPCFVTLVVFESEGRVDPDLARESLASCPEPGERPADGSEGAARVWAEEVRRRVHLVASFQPPGDVLEEAERWLSRMQAAGIVAEDGSVRWSKAEHAAAAVRVGIDSGVAADVPAQGDAQAAPGDGAAAEGQSPAPEAKDAGTADREAPDPVFAVRVLAAGAAVASGSMERLLAAFGGESAACSSMFLAALGFLQAVDLPRQAALPMILRAMVARAPLDVVATLSDRVSLKFKGKPCAVQALVSSLALSSLTAEVVDAAFKQGKGDRVVHLVAAAPAVIPVHGSPATRAAILADAVGLLKEGERIERMCQLGQARLDGADVDGALGTFQAAADEAQDEGAKGCVVEGRFRALILGRRTQSPAFGEAAVAWLTRDPAPREILERLLEPPDAERRSAAVKALAAVVMAKGSPGRQPVLEALLKVVDDAPGTPEAGAARVAVDAAGFPEDPQGRVTWALVAGRHHVTANEPIEARKAFDRAFGGLKPDMESARTGVVALLRWAAVDAKYALLDDLLPRAGAAHLLTPALLADLAGIVGEVGQRDRARRFVAMARGLKPSEPEEWVALADASARIEDTAVATKDLRRAGPEATWGGDAWMVQGRIASARGLHRDAVVAYSKAMEKRPTECQPRFFRGLALLLVGDPEGAESDFSGCVDDGSMGSQVMGALGYAQFDQSRFDDAEATFRRALERDSTAADNHLGLAMVLLRKGDVEGALAAWSRAVLLEPILEKGAKAASRKGFVYSDVQKKAWDDLRAARAGRKGGAK